MRESQSQSSSLVKLEREETLHSTHGVGDLRSVEYVYPVRPASCCAGSPQLNPTIPPLQNPVNFCNDTADYYNSCNERWVCYRILPDSVITERSGDYSDVFPLWPFRRLRMRSSVRAGRRLKSLDGSLCPSPSMDVAIGS